jgi:hypothetical protein
MPTCPDYHISAVDDGFISETGRQIANKKGQ